MSRPQRLVLKVNNRAMTVGDLALFMESVVRLELPHDGTIEVVDEGDIRYFYAPLPNKRRKTKQPEMSSAERAIQRAADRQIQQRQEAVKNGEVVSGHVPPAVPRRTIKVRKSVLASIKNGKRDG